MTGILPKQLYHSRIAESPNPFKPTKQPRALAWFVGQLRKIKGHCLEGLSELQNHFPHQSGSASNPTYFLIFDTYLCDQPCNNGFLKNLWCFCVDVSIFGGDDFWRSMENYKQKHKTGDVLFCKFRGGFNLFEKICSSNWNSFSVLCREKYKNLWNYHHRVLNWSKLMQVDESSSWDPQLHGSFCQPNSPSQPGWPDSSHITVWFQKIL